jgi:Core-2/I-Branching enzyme
MNPPIGFALATHSNPRQLERLVSRLNAMFDHPPIACHHDFSQCALSTDRFPKNVSFVRPHLRSAWGAFSLVQVFIRAIEQLYAAPVNPDWCVLLSGADYPIKPAAQILNDLQAGGYDAHICHEWIRAGALETVWQKVSYERYCWKWIRVPLTNKRLILKHPLLTRPFLPFSKKFRCYSGSDWFSTNRRATQYLVESYKSNVKLANYYRQVFIPSESYFHTILANAPALKLKNDNWRYTDWLPGSPHPRTLGLADLPKLLASPAHFARKFDLNHDAAVLDQLDEITA